MERSPKIRNLHRNHCLQKPSKYEKYMYIYIYIYQLGSNRLPIIMQRLKNCALCLLFIYFNSEKQNVKRYLSFSFFQCVISALSWDSLLVPLLFNIFLTNICFILLRLQAMLKATHYTQEEIVWKKLWKMKKKSQMQVSVIY